MRSIINDPMIGGDVAMIDHMNTLFDSMDLDEELAALEVPVLNENGEPTGQMVLAADVDNSGDVTREEMLEFIKAYDETKMVGEVKTIVNDMVKDYLFKYAKHQFVVGAGGNYETELTAGKTTGGTEYVDPFKDIFDWE